MNIRKSRTLSCSGLVGEGGFEPPKSLTADLQSVPFGHSGIPPYSLCCTHFETQRSGFKMKRRKAIADMELFASAESGMEQASFDGGAGRRIRTPDLLITNQLLYRLSYTSRKSSEGYNSKSERICQHENKSFPAAEKFSAAGSVFTLRCALPAALPRSPQRALRALPRR